MKKTMIFSLIAAMLTAVLLPACSADSNDGADIANEHTPNETLQIASIPKTYKLLSGILAKIA